MNVISKCSRVGAAADGKVGQVVVSEIQGDSDFSPEEGYYSLLQGVSILEPISNCQNNITLIYVKLSVM